MQCTRMVIVVLTAACLLWPLPPAVTPRGAAHAGQVTWRCVTNRRTSLNSCHPGTSLCSHDLRLLVPVGPMDQGACCYVRRRPSSSVVVCRRPSSSGIAPCCPSPSIVGRPPLGLSVAVRCRPCHPSSSSSTVGVSAPGGSGPGPSKAEKKAWREGHETICRPSG